jgi:fucose 4-O-acetylase-like acetyltransferase
MAHGLLKVWNTDKKRILWSFGIGVVAILIAVIIRMARGYGNIFPFSDFGSYSFFFDQKYPPSLFFSLWFFGYSLVVISIIIAINKLLPKLFLIFDITGKVALFFYCMHIAILGVFSKRLGLYYREGDVAATLIGVVIMMIVMVPLSQWFYKVKTRSKNYIIKMM